MKDNNLVYILCITVHRVFLYLLPRQIKSPWETAATASLPSYTGGNQRVCWVKGKVQVSEKGCMARFASLKVEKQLWGLPQTCRDEVEVAILRVHTVVLLKVILR